MAIIQRKTDENEIRYLVRVRDPFGRWYPSATFERRVDAERFERELLNRKDSGSLARASVIRQMTFAEYWAQWSEECRTQVSAGWKSCQDRLMRKHLLPILGRMKLLEVRSQEIGRLMGILEKQGMSPQSRLHAYNVLHKMFGDAVEFYEFLELNPIKKRFRPKIRREEREFLTPAESWRLLEVSRQHPCGAAVWISLLAGLRPGEVQALRWSAIDFDRSQILIRATFNKKLRVIQDYPKQGDWGRAPIPKALYEFLKERSIGKTSEDFVAENWLGGMLCYESFAIKVLPALCRQAGVKRITPHELRHSCTELYVEAGASAEDIRRLLNHKSLTATLRYIHRTDERLMGVASRVGNPESAPLRLVK
jgi:integrase